MPTQGTATGSEPSWTREYVTLVGKWVYVVVIGVVAGIGGVVAWIVTSNASWLLLMIGGLLAVVVSQVAAGRELIQQRNHAQAELASKPQTVHGHSFQGLNISHAGTGIVFEGLDPEQERQMAVLVTLYLEYVAEQDDPPPGLLAGTEPLPKEWAERRLAELGETWRAGQYRLFPDDRPHLGGG